MKRHARESGWSRGRGSGALALAAFLVLLTLAPNAAAAPKQIANQLGSPDTGQAGGRFNVARGVAVNQTGAGGVSPGTFYVVDQENQRVQRFSPTGTFLSTWGWGVGAGNDEFEICTEARACRQGGSGQAGAAGKFEEPKSIAIDQSSGKVYVSDPNANHRRINVFSAKGAFEGAFGLGVIDASSNFQFCTTQTGCRRPSSFNGGRGGAFPGEIGGLAVDAAGNVYVANTANRRVDVFKPTFTVGIVTDVEFLRSFGWDVVTGGVTTFEVCTVSTSCRQGSGGSNLGQFAAVNSPSDIAIDSEDNAFALDAGNNRIQEFDSIPEPVDASFGSATLQAIFDDGATKGGLLNIAVDPSTTPNHLLVSGSRTGSADRVAIVELDGSGNNALGAGNVHGEDLPITSANGLAVAKASIGGNLYLSTETVGTLRGVFVLSELPTIEPVTVFTGTTATFEGEVVSNEIDVSYHFEYSTDGKTWTNVPASDLSTEPAPGMIPVEAEAHGLTGSQDYRVRLVQNRVLGGGIATSAETTFTTRPEKPAILGTVASPVKDTSATFNANLDPQNEATAYRFQYGLADCSANPCTDLPVSEANGGGFRLVTQAATGLKPATTYHFRLIATNATGTTEGPDRSFETFVAGAPLPDNRAYELVTPPDTGAVVLNGTPFGESDNCFDFFPATATGDSVVSMSKGGSLPGLDVNGRFDLYQSVRDPVTGWSTVANSASGMQSNNGVTGLCTSPDHLYSTFGTGAAPGDKGTLVVEGEQSNYIRIPDGVRDPACSPEVEGLFELTGCGSLGTDPGADARWITSGASHVILTSRVQLEPGAPAGGTEAVYDRSPGGPTHVVSLLPGGVTPEAGEDAQFQGTSVDGSTVAFKLPTNGTLYARVDNATTIAAPDALVGESLACTGGPSFGPGAPALSYQWLRNGATIGGATSSTYTTQAADAGAAVQCQVTAVNTVEDEDGGFVGTTDVSNPAVVVDPAPATAPPVAPNFLFPAQSGPLNGTADRELTCDAGAWGGSPTSFIYQWYRNGAPFGSAVGPTSETSTKLTLLAAEQSPPAAFQCTVTGANAGGSVTKASRSRNTSGAQFPSPSVPSASASTPSTEKAFAGISNNGDHLFYVQAGDVFDLDTTTQATGRLVGSGDARLVNISDDGSHVYFVSKTALTGNEQNDQGQEAQTDQNNLYVWERASEDVHFVTIVDPKDVQTIEGISLTRWTDAAVSPNPGTFTGRANDSSRTTPDGSVLLFESRANITGYDSAGHVEIYRYDAAADNSLDCVSCPANGLPANADARLVVPQLTPLRSTSSIVHIQNVTDDGQKVFFQTEDSLVPGDANETWDVYEWKAGQQPYLISSGHSALPSYLYGMTPSGSDVFFTTAERLVPQDVSTVFSIYDARQGGGFPVAKPESACLPDGNCQGSPDVAPRLPDAGSADFTGPGNLRRGSCARAARRAKRQSNRAKRLRRNGRRLAAAGKRRHARGLKRRAVRHAKRAQRSSKSAKRCRAARRANLDRRAAR